MDVNKIHSVYIKHDILQNRSLLTCYPLKKRSSKNALVANTISHLLNVKEHRTLYQLLQYINKDYTFD